MSGVTKWLRGTDTTRRTIVEAKVHVERILERSQGRPTMMAIHHDASRALSPLAAALAAVPDAARQAEALEALDRLAGRIPATANAERDYDIVLAALAGDDTVGDLNARVAEWLFYRIVADDRQNTSASWERITDAQREGWLASADKLIDATGLGANNVLSLAAVPDAARQAEGGSDEEREAPLPVSREANGGLSDLQERGVDAARQAEALKYIADGSPWQRMRNVDVAEISAELARVQGERDAVRAARDQAETLDRLISEQTGSIVCWHEFHTIESIATCHQCSVAFLLTAIEAALSAAPDEQAEATCTCPPDAYSGHLHGCPTGSAAAETET